MDSHTGPAQDPVETAQSPSHPGSSNVQNPSRRTRERELDKNLLIELRHLEQTTAWPRSVIRRLHSYHDLTGEYVRDYVRQIQYCADSFPFQHGTPNILEWNEESRAHKFYPYIYNAYAVESESFITGFLWRLLIGEIHNQFRWLPHMQKEVAQLYQLLLLSRSISSLKLYPGTILTAIDADLSSAAEARVQAWKVTTLGLVIEVIGERNIQETKENFSSTLCREALDFLKPFIGSSDDGFNYLEEIIDKFVALDLLVSTSRARIDWVLPSREDPVVFDPDIMECAPLAPEPRSGDQVTEIVAPLLKQIGFFGGENPEGQSVLLKMRIKCAH